MTPIRRLATTLLFGVLTLAQMAGAAEFVGIPDQIFATHYRPQHESMWCWASCMEMALSYAGIELPQERIVARQQGEGVNIGALPSDLVELANGLFRTTTGDRALVSSQFLGGQPPITVLYNHLRRGAPAILLYKRADGDGHAVVLTGIDVDVDPVHGLAIEAFHVFDPSLGAGLDDANSVDPLSFRRIVRTIPGDQGLAIASGTIDGVVLMDSTRLDAPTKIQ